MELSVGSLIRRAFFFPLDSTPKIYNEQMEAAEERYRKFWDPKEPIDSNLTMLKEIRDHFHPIEKDITVYLNGQAITLTCTIIEPKVMNKGRPCYNFALLPGSTATAKEMICIYPYLEAFLKKYKNQNNAPQARFVIFSLYNLKSYKPANLEEAGHIIHNAIDQLTNEYKSRFRQLVAHSLGCILFSATFPYFDSTPQTLPENICLDRGPCSIDKASQKYWHGPLTLLFAKLTGWSLSTEDQIKERADFIKKHNISILVAGVERDHHFFGPANLCNSVAIKTLQKAGRLKVVVFDPPLSFHEISHHSLSPKYLDYTYIQPELSDKFLKEGQNLAQAIIQNSLQPRDETRRGNKKPN